MRYISTGLAAVLAFISFWGQGAISETETEAKHSREESSGIAYAISVDGPALFYIRSNAERRILWRVNCALPLRGCIAKANGLALSVDAKGRAYLFAAKPHGARVSLQMKNYALDSPALLNEALPEALISQIGKPKSFVLVESEGLVLLRTPTEGIDQVISYLRWINKPLARTLRDARLWPDHQSRNSTNEKMSLESLERLEILQRRHAAAPNRLSTLIPSTKPQIEFAISAQSGNSFYSNNGRAGY